MALWFVSINGEQKGPYQAGQLLQLVSDGYVARDAYVWRDGMAQWQPLTEVNLTTETAAASRTASPGPQFQQATTAGASYQMGSFAGPPPVSDKRILPLFLLLFFLGFLGVHRFYAGKILTGILFIVTIGGFGIWYIVDLIYIVVGGFTDSNGNKITQWT